MVIKYFNLFLVALLFYFSLTGCEEEKAHPRDYPRVRTLPVSNITAEGATFKGDLYSLGTEPIKEYGFVWGPNIDPGLESDKVILPGENAALGIYTAEIRSTLKEGTEYTVKSFIKTDSHVVYGTPLTFVSLGSMAPLITGFEPDTVIWGDTLKINGKNFSYIPSKNIVRINQTECFVISSTDTTLFTIVRSALADSKSRISVEISGNSSLYDKKDLFIKMPVISGMFPISTYWGESVTITGKNIVAGFNEFSVSIGSRLCSIIEKKKDSLTFTVSELIITPSNEVNIKINGVDFTVPGILTLSLPEIKSIAPRSAGWGDTIIISGNNFRTGRNNFSVSISDQNCNFIKYNEDALKAVVPLNLESVTNDIKIKINNILEITAPEQFELSHPLIKSIMPKEGTWGDTLTISGRFHTSPDKNIINIGGYYTALISNTRDTLKVIVPQELIVHENKVVLNSGPFTVTSAQSFLLKPPSIISVSPLTGPGGTEVIIKGNNFYKDAIWLNHVYFGSQEASVISSTSTEIVCFVPISYVNESVPVTVQTGEQSYVYKDKFNIICPVISRIYPLNGFYDDDITIEGYNFLIGGNDINVSFNDVNNLYYAAAFAVIKSASDNRIVVKVPYGIDSIPKKIMIRILGSETYSQQQFILNPPEISGVSPFILFPGTNINILGKNFNPFILNNQVFLGNRNIPVISATTTQIVASLPNAMTRGNYRISIITAGYKRTYNSVFEVKSKWREIDLPDNFQWYSSTEIGGNGFSFSTTDAGYIMDYNQGFLTSYNPVSGEFSNLGQYSEFTGLAMQKGIVNRDTLYLMLGSVGISRFDPASKSWVKIIDPVETEYKYGVAFSINGKIYKGLDHIIYANTFDNRFWILDPVKKAWIPKKNFPGFSERIPEVYFVIGNKGYVLFDDKVFCEYDPSEDKWTRLSPFPGPGYNRRLMVSFVLNNKGYVGSGIDYENEYDDFWEYSPQLNSWQESIHIPWGGQCNMISFVVKNKAYVGFGQKNSVVQTELYEFDPYYPVK